MGLLIGIDRFAKSLLYWSGCSKQEGLIVTQGHQEAGSEHQSDQSPAIDPESFRIPASDTHGHSERMWFRVQPGHNRQIGITLQSRWFPYRSSGDLIRHAIHRHLQWLESLAPVASVTKQVDAILELVRDDEFNDDFKEVFNRMGERVGAYIAGGQIDRARSMVARIASMIEEMPDGTWKDQYRGEISQKFGYLLRGETIPGG